ncbi:cell volume regulation protein A [Deinococcus metalli]|uniref:Cell volume regulation protein A n=1 Tax=Deinococcus metalli TaxID=1141878 RepID=A0A7W8KFX7_9DEIO|nr:potassium/proton antiporter [Deinococcus metalli]MBB5377387.1 cell volume regulation protein A [Deinococcus metalli]GHF50040.1 K+/H+ antiporter [Deinococcus metalli]
MGEVHVELVLLVAGALLLVSLGVSRLGGRLGIPGLLLFLGVGMLFGSDGLGIQFQNYRLAQAIGTLALCFILFQGGLDTNWVSTRPVVRRGLSLATVGVLGTAGIMAAFTHFAFGFPWLVAWLLGAVVSSTDASAVFSVLKERQLGLKGDVTPLLEFESGGNDPMAVFLTVGLLELIASPDTSVLTIVPLFLKQMLIGALAGYALGRAALWIINRIQLQFEGLYSVLSIALALIVFGGAAVAGGSGFLAIYIAGVVLGNAEFIHKRSLVNFHDGLSWLMQVAMFLTLGLLVNPHDLLPTAGLALACALVLVFLARPLSVYVALANAKMPANEKGMVAWVGLRGAVPIVLATFPLLAHVPQAQTLFNIVFFIVLTSVLLQGTTLTLVARWLRVRENMPAVPAYPIAYTPTGQGKNGMVEVEVRAGSEAAGQRIVDLRLPPEALLILVHRGGEFLIPKGATQLLAGDSVLVLATGDALRAVRERLTPA